jgi:hypothetical protein
MKDTTDVAEGGDEICDDDFAVPTMPTFKYTLSEEEIWAIVGYVRGLHGGKMEFKVEERKKQLAAAYKKAGQPVYAVLSSYSGNRNEYTTVTFVMKFGDLDNPSPIQKALGDEAFTNLVGAIARCVTSTTWYFSVPWDDVSIDKASSLGPYFLRTRVPIATGKNADYRAYVKNELRPVLEKGGVTWYRASAPTFGGPAGTVETMRMLKNLGEIDGGPIQTRVLGAAGAQALAAKVASLTRGPAQNTILRLRPELSLLPPAMPAK